MYIPKEVWFMIAGSGILLVIEIIVYYAKGWDKEDLDIIDLKAKINKAQEEITRSIKLLEENPNVEDSEIWALRKLENLKEILKEENVKKDR